MSSPSAIQHPSAHLQHQTYADEISLFDLWDILVRYRWRLLAVWALVVLAAAAYLAVAQPVFESRSVVRVGRVEGEFIVRPAILALELKERYDVGEKGRERPFMKSVKVEDTDAIVLQAEAHSAEEAQSFLLEAVSEVLEQQLLQYNDARSLRERALADLEAEIELLNGQAQQLAEVAENANVDEAVRALIVLQRSTLQADLPALHEKKLELQRALSRIQTYPTQVIREPTLPEHASSPRKALTLGLALVLGGMLGCLAAFLSEFLHQAKNRHRQSA